MELKQAVEILKERFKTNDFLHNGIDGDFSDFVRLENTAIEIVLTELTRLKLLEEINDK